MQYGRQSPVHYHSEQRCGIDDGAHLITKSLHVKNCTSLFSLLTPTRCTTLATIIEEYKAIAKALASTATLLTLRLLCRDAYFVTSTSIFTCSSTVLPNPVDVTANCRRPHTFHSFYFLFFTLAQLYYRSLQNATARNGAICINKIVVSRHRQQMYTTATQDTLPSTRFDWRLRASSRVKKDEKEDGENSGYQKRLRPMVTDMGVGKPFFNAIRQYSEKYVGFSSA